MNTHDSVLQRSLDIVIHSLDDVSEIEGQWSVHVDHKVEMSRDRTGKAGGTSGGGGGSNVPWTDSSFTLWIFLSPPFPSSLSHPSPFLQRSTFSVSPPGGWRAFQGLVTRQCISVRTAQIKNERVMRCCGAVRKLASVVDGDLPSLLM